MSTFRVEVLRSDRMASDLRTIVGKLGTKGNEDWAGARELHGELVSALHGELREIGEEPGSHLPGQATLDDVDRFLKLMQFLLGDLERKNRSHAEYHAREALLIVMRQNREWPSPVEADRFG